MALKSLTIHGYRGFAEPETVRFAIPNGNYGTGLTIIVGPNNAGKSTIIESLQAIASRELPSFAEDKRNKRAGDRIAITMTNAEGGSRTLATGGGSQAAWTHPDLEPKWSRFFMLQSRRRFDPFFGAGKSPDRAHYVRQQTLPANRGSVLNFSQRLFTIQDNRTAFDSILRRVVNPVPEWQIDQYATGQHYLKVRSGDFYHSGEGLGDGLVSIMFIVDALYDSQPGDIIAIDEPELSLHPDLQKRLCTVVGEYAKDRQIILATHSPYFVDWKSIAAGAAILRVQKRDQRSVIRELGSESREYIQGVIGDQNNPHVLGLDASEVFFIPDRVMLVEGQEDVLCYRRILADLKIEEPGTFFGWGVGGASKMRLIASILRDLGFEKVAGILDRNQARELERLRADFPRYQFETIPADDVRTKPATAQRGPVVGLLDENWHLRQEYREDARRLFEKLGRTLAGSETEATLAASKNEPVPAS